MEDRIHDMLDKMSHINSSLDGGGDYLKLIMDIAEMLNKEKWNEQTFISLMDGNPDRKNEAEQKKLETDRENLQNQLEQGELRNATLRAELEKKAREQADAEADEKGYPDWMRERIYQNKLGYFENYGDTEITDALAEVTQGLRDAYDRLQSCDEFIQDIFNQNVEDLSKDTYALRDFANELADKQDLINKMSADFPDKAFADNLRQTISDYYGEKGYEKYYDNATQEEWIKHNKRLEQYQDQMSKTEEQYNREISKRNISPDNFQGYDKDMKQEYVAGLIKNIGTDMSDDEIAALADFITENYSLYENNNSNNKELVKALQKVLAKIGFKDITSATGLYSEKTRAAIAAITKLVTGNDTNGKEIGLGEKAQIVQLLSEISEGNDGIKNALQNIFNGKFDQAEFDRVTGKVNVVSNSILNPNNDMIKKAQEMLRMLYPDDKYPKDLLKKLELFRNEFGLTGGDPTTIGELTFAYLSREYELQSLPKAYSKEMIASETQRIYDKYDKVIDEIWHGKDNSLFPYTSMSELDYSPDSSNDSVTMLFSDPFSRGMSDAVVDAVHGIGALFKAETYQNLGYVISHPMEFLTGVKDKITEIIDKDIINGDTESRTYVVGRAVGEVLVYVTTAKGIEKVVEISKSGAVADITSKIGKIFKNSDEAVSNLYRAIGPEEFYKVMDKLEFDIIAEKMQAKQFGLSFKEVLEYSNEFPDYVAIIEVKIPSEVLETLIDTTHVDTSIFRTGTISIQPENLSEFNKAIISITHKY